MGADPGDFCLKQSDPLGQFVLRIGIEQFLRQQAGGIAFYAGQVIIHVTDQNRTVCACCQRGKRVGAVAVASGQQGTGKWLKRFHKP